MWEKKLDLTFKTQTNWTKKKSKKHDGQQKIYSIQKLFWAFEMAHHKNYVPMYI